MSPVSQLADQPQIGTNECLLFRRVSRAKTMAATLLCSLVRTSPEGKLLQPYRYRSVTAGSQWQTNTISVFVDFRTNCSCCSCCCSCSSTSLQRLSISDRDSDRDRDHDHDESNRVIIKQ